MSFVETRNSACCFDSCPHEAKKFYAPSLNERDYLHQFIKRVNQSIKELFV